MTVPLRLCIYCYAFIAICVWQCMAMHVSMAMYDYVRYVWIYTVCMAMYGNVCMVCMYGYVWLCNVCMNMYCMYGYVCLYGCSASGLSGSPAPSGIGRRSNDKRSLCDGSLRDTERNSISYQTSLSPIESYQNFLINLEPWFWFLLRSESSVPCTCWL